VKEEIVKVPSWWPDGFMKILSYLESPSDNQVVFIDTKKFKEIAKYFVPIL
jgi:hypothetical protein